MCVCVGVPHAYASVYLCVNTDIDRVQNAIIEYDIDVLLQNGYFIPFVHNHSKGTHIIVNLFVDILANDRSILYVYSIHFMNYLKITCFLVNIQLVNYI